MTFQNRETGLKSFLLNLTCYLERFWRDIFNSFRPLPCHLSLISIKSLRVLGGR